MTFSTERDLQAWVALTQTKHQRLAKARAIAVEAAFRDLPHNEQVRYLELAYQAVKAEERAS